MRKIEQKIDGIVIRESSTVTTRRYCRLIIQMQFTFSRRVFPYSGISFDALLAMHNFPSLIISCYGLINGLLHEVVTGSPFLTLPNTCSVSSYLLMECCVLWGDTVTSCVSGESRESRGLRAGSVHARDPVLSMCSLHTGVTKLEKESETRKGVPEWTESHACAQMSTRWGGRGPEERFTGLQIWADTQPRVDTTNTHSKREA